MLNVSRYIILLFSICMFTIGLIFNNEMVLLVAICSLLVHNLWYSLESFNERIIFFSFNVTFFTFLVGRLVIKTVTNYEDFYNNNKFGLDFNNDQIIWSIFISLFISLLFLFIGYSLVRNKDSINMNNFQGVSKGLSIESIAIVSKYLYYFTFVFSVLILLDQARFTNEVGYTELYASYSSSLPYIFVKFSEMCPAALFMFLATLPAKKKALIPLMLYLLLGTLSLVVGNRNDFVLNILIVIIYFCLRNLTDKNEKWFGKKEIIVCMSAFPLLILILNAVSYIRLDSTMTSNSFIDIISDFFYKQGVSVNLIGYAQTLAHQLPDGTIYSFGRLTDFFRNNYITQILFDVPKYTSQTVESALYGNSFADSVSYILSPKRYINGWGYGSSYVAELFKDFSYIGVALGNLIFGIILAYMSKLFKTNIFGAWICLSMTRLLLYAPRDTATSFIVSTFSLINLLTVAIILLGAVLLGNSQRISPHLFTRNENLNQNS